MIMYYIAALIFGLILGSFLNVVIYRYDDWLSILKDRSHCMHCKTTLGPLDLVPILSFIALRGKCRYCKKPISWQYPLVELTMGLMVMAGYQLLFVWQDMALARAIWAYAFYIMASGAMLAIFVHDIKEMMIPDSLSNFLIIVAIGFMVSTNQIINGFYGALIGFLPIALLVYPSKGKWMGEGDVKLSTALGILTGWPLAVVYLALSFMLGGFIGAIGLATRKAKLKTAVPFGPFLIVGAYIALFYGQAIIDWYIGRMIY